MRLIDKDMLIEILGEMQGLCDTKAALIQNSKIWQQVKDLPTVDAVEVIRCKDCKNSDPWYADERRCFLWSENGISVFDDGFCNYAESKEE